MLNGGEKQRDNLNKWEGRGTTQGKLTFNCKINAKWGKVKVLREHE